jgi:flagellar L-ring protein precursor FlgH
MSRLALFVALCCLVATAQAQSLLRRPVAEQPSPTAAPAPSAPPTASPGMLAPEKPAEERYPLPASAPKYTPVTSSLSAHSASLLLVQAPKPRTYAVHDKVSIIIAESSTQSSQQKLDAKKDSSLKAAVNKFPDLAMFLEGNLTNVGTGTIASADVTGSRNFKGDGKFERTDKFQDRIQATVIDVKPNGVLVLEARKTVGQDREVRTLVLSGECRREDITENNTILSSQLAELTIMAYAQGDAKDTASKGVITRFLDTIFNF